MNYKEIDTSIRKWPLKFLRLIIRIHMNLTLTGHAEGKQWEWNSAWMDDKIRIKSDVNVSKVRATKKGKLWRAMIVKPRK